MSQNTPTVELTLGLIGKTVEALQEIGVELARSIAKTGAPAKTGKTKIEPDAGTLAETNTEAATRGSADADDNSAAGESTSAPRRTRRTKAQIEADEAAARAAVNNAKETSSTTADAEASAAGEPEETLEIPEHLKRAADTAPTAEPEAKVEPKADSKKELTLQDVKDAARAYKQKNGDTALIGVLQTLGVTSFTAIKPENFGDAIKALAV